MSLRLFFLEKSFLSGILLLCFVTNKFPYHEWYFVWAMALLTGMRNGELYALKWNDVDFDNKTIKLNDLLILRLMNLKIQKLGIGELFLFLQS